MHETQTRLLKCFQGVFPGLSAEEALAATSVTLPEWDSVSSVTLLTVIEEEFGVNLGIDVLDDFGSFKQILDRLNGAGESL